MKNSEQTVRANIDWNQYLKTAEEADINPETVMTIIGAEVELDYRSPYSFDDENPNTIATSITNLLWYWIYHRRSKITELMIQNNGAESGLSKRERQNRIYAKIRSQITDDDTEINTVNARDAITAYYHNATPQKLLYWYKTGDNFWNYFDVLTNMLYPNYEGIIQRGFPILLRLMPSLSDESRTVVVIGYGYANDKTEYLKVIDGNQIRYVNIERMTRRQGMEIWPLGFN